MAEFNPEQFNPILADPDETLMRSGYACLVDVFELHKQGSSIECETFGGFAFRKFHLGNPPPDNVDVYSESEVADHYARRRAVDVVLTAKFARRSIGILKNEYDIDLLNDRTALADHNTYRRCVGDLKRRSDDESGVGVSGEEEFCLSLAIDLANIFGTKSQNFEAAIEDVDDAIIRLGVDRPVHKAAMLLAQHVFYESIAGRKIGDVRFETQRQLRRLCQDDVTTVIEYADNALAVISQKWPAEAVLAEAAEELDFEILPDGTVLRKVAEHIVSSASERTRPHIDLKRLVVLERLRQYIGPDNCRFVRGKHRGLERETDMGTLFSEAYIGLAIERVDEATGEMREDCLVVSPIAGRDAGFIARQDVSEGLPWRQVFTMTKDDAVRYFGVRRLRFDPIVGVDTYDAYYEKVLALLACDKDSFGRDYILSRNRKDGSYITIPRVKKLGGVGVSREVEGGEQAS